MFVYREEYYLEQGAASRRPGADEHIERMGQMERAHGRAEVIIGRQRHGPTGMVELQFAISSRKSGRRVLPPVWTTLTARGRYESAVAPETARRPCNRSRPAL
jgi:DnaB-like helicase C terminal domain